MRLGYAWEQQRTTPHWALASVPFLYEPGNIAHSLAVGKGFASPFHEDTGPTAWDPPVYPLIVAGVFRVFRHIHVSRVCRSRFAEYCFLVAGVCADFFRW